MAQISRRNNIVIRATKVSNVAEQTSPTNTVLEQKISAVLRKVSIRTRNLVISVCNTANQNRN